MSSRMFQSVIVQMKEATDRTIGVIDADGNVVSCSETSMIGEKWLGGDPSQQCPGFHGDCGQANHETPGQLERVF